MIPRPNLNERINLSEFTVLLIDDNQQSLDILSSVVQGFGVGAQIKCASAAEGAEVVKQRPVDLILVDCVMPEMDGCEFTRWLRREDEPLRFTPVIMLTGNAMESTVQKSRDCGANFIVTKPLAPNVLLQRIQWVGLDQRQFISCDTYSGPDRRVRNFGPPVGMAGRREGDLSADIGFAVEANMDQSDIDMLMKPQRVSL